MQKLDAGTDTLRSAYKKLENWEERTTQIFWTSVGGFFVYVVAEWFDYQHLKSFALIVFIIATLSTIAIASWSRYAIAARADLDRTYQMLGDAFGHQTFHGQRAGQGYYTSRLLCGNQRLLANLHQSCFFKQSLYGHELKFLGLKVLLWLVLALASLRVGTPKLIEFFWVVLLFSDAIGGKLVRLVFMHLGYIRLNEKLTTLAESYRKGEDPLHELLAVFAEYETIKARFALRVAMHHSDKTNEETERRWQAVAGPLGLLEAKVNND